tara:strand:- start:341 stop:1048 length:708 start_codon:yes stop_codon:yes gene_type:complete
MTEIEQTEAPKKPWYKKIWVWVVIAAVFFTGAIVTLLGVALAIGLALGNTEEFDSAPTPTSTPTSTTETVEVLDVVGQDGAAARDALTALGFEVEFDAGDDTVIIASNWTVDSQSPLAGSPADAGDTVTLTVNKPEAVEQPQSDELDEVTAAQFLALAWEDRFIYGGDVHWIVDRISTANDDGTWTFKIGVTLENAFGNKYEGVIEGDVGGTRSAPTIIDSILYTDTGEVINYNE